MNKYLYFWLFCIPIRIIFVILALKLSTKYLPYYGTLLLIPSIGFLVLYFTNIKNNGLFSEEAWWKDHRLIHGGLFLIASIYCLKKNNFSYLPLLISVFIGILNWLNHYKYLSI